MSVSIAILCIKKMEIQSSHPISQDGLPAAWWYTVEWRRSCSDTRLTPLPSPWEPGLYFLCRTGAVTAVPVLSTFTGKGVLLFKLRRRMMNTLVTASAQTQESHAQTPPNTSFGKEDREKDRGLYVRCKPGFPAPSSATLFYPTCVSKICHSLNTPPPLTAPWHSMCWASPSASAPSKCLLIAQFPSPTPPFCEALPSQERGVQGVPSPEFSLYDLCHVTHGTLLPSI